jgi:membrane protease subunit HflC
MRRSVALALLLGAVAVFASFCLVIIDVREQGFRTVLGDPDPSIFGFHFNRAVLDQPGVYVRIPGLHDLEIYDKRTLLYDAAPKELYLNDQLAIVVDYYLTYRIVDPQKLREELRTRDNLLRQLDDTSFSQVRQILGRRVIADLLSDRRAQVMETIAKACDAEMRPRGIEVTDLRVRSTDFPESNEAQVFERMRKERERFARKFRAEGDEEANKIRSKADLDSQVLLADAKRKAETLRGEGDAEATRVYAGAYNKDPDFYGFLRTLEAYELALDDKTTLILSPKVPFLRHLFEQGERSPTP